jgi:hypothetical protein
VLPAGVSPAVADQAAMHFTQPAPNDPLQCGDTTYTPISGELVTVVHEGLSASGNTNLTSTITARDAVLQDQYGNLYSVAGAIWFGGTFNANTGGFEGTSTDKFQIVAQGAARWTASTGWSTSAPTARNSPSTSGPAPETRSPVTVASPPRRRATWRVQAVPYSGTKTRRPKHPY